jgi:zinc protease
MRYSLEVSIENSSNQIRTVFVDQPGSTSGTIQLWFNAGSALENKDDHGVAHFLEHMFFKGTKKRPGNNIAFDTESFGGEINAFTSFDYTCYYINAPFNKLKNALDILMDMVAAPLFSKEDIPAEKEVVYEEFLRSQDSSQQFSFQKLQKQIFSKGYNHPILGSAKHIKNFSKQQITKFRNTHYNKSNLTIVIAGDIKNKTNYLKTIAKYKMPKGKANDFPKLSVKAKPTLDINEKDVEMVQVSYTISSRDINAPQSPADDLAWNCIGSGESSKLYRELVQEDSLCNSATAFSYYFKTSGMHMIRINCPKDNVPEALKRIEKFISEVKDEGVDKNILSKIKNQYLASKVYEKESLEQYAFSIGHSLTQFNDHESDSKFIKLAEKATIFNVNNSIQEIFGRSVHVSALFPKGSTNEETKKLFEQHLKNLNQTQEKAKKKKVKSSKSKHDPKVKVISIDEGIQLIYRHNDMTPTFSFQVYLKAGLANETWETNGTYHQLANILVQGHSGIEIFDYKRQVERLAASINGFAGKNAYGLTTHAQAKDFEEILDHFKGCLRNANFSEEVLQNELQIADRYLDAFEKDPAKKCFELIAKKFFNENPYSFNIIGNKDSLKTITVSQLKEMHESNLKEKEMTFFYGGPASEEEVIRHIEDICEGLPSRKRFDFPQVTIPIKDHSPSFLEMDREQTHLFMGKPIAGLDDQSQTFYKILSAHLSGQSSELFFQMRDVLGLCYVVQPVHFAALQCGYWGIYMASGNNKANEAIQTLQIMLKDLATKGISQKDLDRVKEYVQGQALLNIQTNDDYAATYCVPSLHHMGIDYFYKEIEKIKKFDLKKFNRLLKANLSDGFEFFSVGAKNPF